MLLCPEVNHAGALRCGPGPALTAAAPMRLPVCLLQPPPSVNILCVPASGRPASWEEVTMQVTGESHLSFAKSCVSCLLATVVL